MTLESDVAGFERFQREEEIGARLNHPAILKVIKVEENEEPALPCHGIPPGCSLAKS